ncbi:serine/threonine-protein kinase [Ruicaihuangia caeni]|uniref:non-specific serine/threonine protein kinase n=1 Tax=Ruicaihuangia caeni TaxID=3042517 RepID=A0AAW6T3H2_9MICO|nr:serine/threonine-protein kinase [Klugiella sp. YN-L-19]MDI2097651.1 serine/threonine-protein kinase [Klugiella sp. YN-L-19]
MRRPPSTPPVLPGFSFVRPLGAGGFSDVFLYEQQLPRRQVAVKVLLTDGVSPADRAAFAAEANLMAQLSTHPFIVTIYHADIADGDRPYFVMEYCSGPSLGERYKRERFAVDDALRTGVRLSSAIATAHAAGILHRDIKPANVLTNDYGWPALTDFGISSTLDGQLPLHTAAAHSGDSAGGDSTAGDSTDGSGRSGTGSQAIGLSVPWSPPELFDDDPQPDVRSDVFSLAATIHTLLAGRTPFEVPGGPNGTLDLIGRIERGAITPIGRDDVPRSLLAVLQKGMAQQRADRYRTAAELARALQRVELELGYSATAFDVPASAIPEGSRPEHPAGDGGPDADETRVKQIVTVQPQQPQPRPQPGPSPQAPAVPAERAAPQSSVLDDRTVVRGASPPGSSSAPSIPPAAPGDWATSGEADHTVLRPPATPGDTSSSKHPGAEHRADPTAEPGDDRVGTQVEAGHASASKSPRRPLIVALAVAAVVLLGGGVATAVVLAGGDVRESSPAPTRAVEPDDAIVVTSPPTPDFVSATPSADGSSVTFVWQHPSAQEGDRFSWAYASQPAKQTRVDDPQLVVPLDGGRVCIQVSVLRAGKLSADPLEMCFPS